MKLSAPIYVLKGQAKKLKVEKSISMSEALNEMAQREGFSSWSLLMAKSEGVFPTKYDDVLEFLNPKDLVIIGARPGMGKTSFTIGLFVKAIRQKKAKHFYFSLAENHMDVAGRMASYDESLGQNNSLFELDYHDEINADYIIEKTKEQVSNGSIVVVDYLQILDQKRTHPELQEQVLKLKEFASDTGVIIIFISQVNRKIEYRYDQSPTVNDIYLPNPIDLNLINKIFLLHLEINKKEALVWVRKPKDYSFKVHWNPQQIKYS